MYGRLKDHPKANSFLEYNIYFKEKIFHLFQIVSVKNVVKGEGTN